MSRLVLSARNGHKSLSTRRLHSRCLVRTLSWARRATHRTQFRAEWKPAQQAIVNPSKLSRERQIDMCGLCHGGVGVAKTPPFFTVGNVLEDHIQLEKPKPDEPLDVHGNQLALLERSKCFINSKMTCSTCHDVHSPQREVSNFREVFSSVTRCRAADCFARAGALLKASALTVTCRIGTRERDLLQPRPRAHHPESAGVMKSFCAEAACIRKPERNSSPTSGSNTTLVAKYCSR